ncbi:MAG: O-antigen ligase family protein, partial [Polyangiaceae bacterium]
LQGIGFMNIVTALAMIGIIVEFGMGKTKSAWSPQLPYLAAFFLWCYLVTMIKAGRSGLSHTNATVFTSTIFMLVVMYGVRSFNRFVAMGAVLVVIGFFLAMMGTIQSEGEFECIIVSAEDIEAGDKSTGERTGKMCHISARECDEEALKDGSRVLENGDEYSCEKPGPFNTFSIAHGRVRWRGVLADPNELSLAIAVSLAFGFALYGYTKSKWRNIAFGAVLALASYCIVQTQSRGGVLVLMVVFAVYFVRRYGWKGLIIGAVLGSPVLLLGGREGEEAESSTLERMGALYEGVNFVRETPIFGLGQGQFGEHYFITAHNSYLLSAAELGLPGMVLWSLLVYVSMKIAYTAAWGDHPGIDPRIRPFAMALFVSFCGIMVGISFLSFCYHALLFIYFGLAGALYGTVKQTCPTFKVKMSGKDFAAVVAGDAVIMTFLFVYTRIKGAP